MAEQVPGPIIPVHQSNAPGTGFDHENFIRHISNSLPLTALKELRGISRAWNSGISHSPSFRAKCTGYLNDHWWNDVTTKLTEFSIERTLQFYAVELSQPAFVQWRSFEFKSFWQHTARILTSLTIQRTKLEPDQYIFLLSHCPALETLSLVNLHLRDLSFYRDAIAQADIDSGKEPTTPNNQRPDPEPLPRTGVLRQLILRHVARMDNAFMDYLIDNTGGLESLELSACFLKGEELDIVPIGQTFTQMFMNFQNKLIRLLHRNQATLRSLKLHCNQFQEYMLGSLAQLMVGLVIPELHLTLLPETYQGATQFLNSPAEVEKLRLKYIGRFTNVELEAAVRNLEGSLQDFELTYNGHELQETINLNWLSRFTRLEKFKLSDSKNLCFVDMQRLVGGKRVERAGVWRRRRFGWGRRRMAQLTVKGLIDQALSKMDPSFLAHLPPVLQNLSINQFICKSNIFENRPTEELTAVFRRLTRLEFRGPWIHSFDGVLPVIVAELQQLRSLTITDCALTDAMLTGLGSDASQELGRCLTYGLALFTQESVPTQEAVLLAVEQNLRLPPAVNDYHGLTDLIHLEHLDLSLNPGISGLSFFYGLRLPELKNLSLSQCANVDDSSLEFLALFCPNLEVLNVKLCLRLSKYGLNTLIRRCKKLRNLYATHCEKILQHHAGLAFTQSPDYEQVVLCSPFKEISPDKEADDAEPSADAAEAQNTA